MSLLRPELEHPTLVGGNAARILSYNLHNSFPCPQPDGRSFVAFRQPVYGGVSPSTVSAAIRLHEPDDVQALISRHYIM